MPLRNSLLRPIWRYLFFPCILAILILLAQPALAGNSASAASRPGQTQTTTAPARALAPPMAIKPATLAWMQTHPTQVQTATKPLHAAVPATLTCQQNENCTCPSTFAASQYYECEWYNGFWPFNGGVLAIS